MHTVKSTEKTRQYIKNKIKTCDDPYKLRIIAGFVDELTK